MALSKNTWKKREIVTYFNSPWLDFVQEDRQKLLTSYKKFYAENNYTNKCKNETETMTSTMKVSPVSIFQVVGGW